MLCNDVISTQSSICFASARTFETGDRSWDISRWPQLLAKAHMKLQTGQCWSSFLCLVLRSWGNYQHGDSQWGLPNEDSTWEQRLKEIHHALTVRFIHFIHYWYLSRLVHVSMLVLPDALEALEPRKDWRYSYFEEVWRSRTLQDGDWVCKPLSVERSQLGKI